MLGAYCLLSYLAALFIVLCIFAVATIHAQRFDWEIMAITAVNFPAGLFVWFTRTGGPWTEIGYLVYFIFMTLSIAFNRRVFLWIFIALLFLNISGCCHSCCVLDNQGWSE